MREDQAREKGYAWREPETREYQITVLPDELPANINGVPDTILQETIGCAHEDSCNESCTTAFRIIAQELAFYRRAGIPLPRLCPNCRHSQRIKLRNPARFVKRQCTCAGSSDEKRVYQNTGEHFHGSSPCPNEFETSYAPDRPEIVYCEACYQSEVV